MKRDYKNIKLEGEWNEEAERRIDRKVCPICGYPLQLKYKRAYGLRLYICTNEPEVCGFMTNDCNGGKLSIQKCDKCRDGYLIIKPGKDASQKKDYFLGCTNYRKDGRGCDRTISKKAFYDQMGYTPDVEEKNDKNDEILVQNRKCTEVKVRKQIQADIADVKIEKVNMESVTLKGLDLNDVVYTVLTAVQNMSRSKYYGVTMLTDILKGHQSERIQQNNLNEIPEYGALKDMTRNEIQAVVEWLIEIHMLLKTKGQYPVLHLTYDGLHYSEKMTVKKLEELKSYMEGKKV